MLSCGERQRSKPVIKELELERFGNEEFKKFMAHVCSLDHIRSTIEDGALQMEPGMSHVFLPKVKASPKTVFMGKKRGHGQLVSFGDEEEWFKALGS